MSIELGPKLSRPYKLTALDETITWDERPRRIKKCNYDQLASLSLKIDSVFIQVQHATSNLEMIGDIMSKLRML